MYIDDNILNVKYNEDKNMLERQENPRIFKIIFKHKVISLVIFFTVIFSIINLLMIYEFMKLLQNF